MLKLLRNMVLAVTAVISGGLVAIAQPAPTPKAVESGANRDEKQKDSPTVTKMMAYGKKQSGKVSRDEVKDERLLRLFDLADTKKEGVVTKDQVVTAAVKLEAEQAQNGGQRGGPDDGGGGGRGGYGGGGGGRGGYGGGGRY